MPSNRSSDIITLLGAGASAEAEIPTSGEMKSRLEAKLVPAGEWRQYCKLYEHIKSSIYYASGLRGTFGNDVEYNIETLVNTLYELERNESHPLYPFIAAWNSRMVGLAGSEFEHVVEFRRQILRSLKQWVCPEDTSKEDYYMGLVRLQSELTYPLRVFSLNYDLCVERLNSNGFRIETGFPGVGPQFPWDWERFDDIAPGVPAPELYLYKLHGSINWKRNPNTGDLYCVEQTENIDVGSMEVEVIFGREFKLEAADPYLFYAYWFRQLSLDAHVILILGYGFADLHINKMLTQALNRGSDKRLVAVCNCKSRGEQDQKAVEIANKLGLRCQEQVVVEEGGVSSFLRRDYLAALIKSYIPPLRDAPF
jgi:hypothetical protein